MNKNISNEEEENWKLEIKNDTGRKENATFIIKNEDHTLGNALKYMLNKNSDVEFVGYSIPHPSDPIMNLRIQTKEGISAVSALQKSLYDLKTMCFHIIQTFENEINLKEDENNFEEKL
jgi:DNA-directed RNA polymerase I and III subunit RPAC2